MDSVSRAQVMRYRTIRNDLHERTLTVDELDLLDLGIPNVPAGSARQALAARFADPLGGTLILAWSTRGAPHLHRPGDLPRLAAALWPLSDADAAARFATNQLPKAAAALGIEAFRVTAAALREVVTRPTAKGEVSRAVSARVPPELTYDCKACRSRHISGGLFQLCGPAGGVRLDEHATKTVLLPADPIPSTPDVRADPRPPASDVRTDRLRPSPEVPADRRQPVPGVLADQGSPTLSQGMPTLDQGAPMLDQGAPMPEVLADPRPPIPDRAAGTADFVRAYLRLLGPATLSDAAKYLGTSATALKAAWPDGLTEVSVDGRRAWLPEEDLDALLTAPPVDGVRLLPPSDPFLQARDRAVLVPDAAQQKEVWRILGNPGVVLADGDLAGTWRARAVRKRLELTVSLWRPVDVATLEAEAETVAAVRGLAGATVVTHEA